MKRGRIFIYLALIIIIAVGAGAAYLWMHRSTTTTPNATQATQQVTSVEIVTAGQNIAPGTAITESMLSSIKIPADTLVQGYFTNKADVVNTYAKRAISQGEWISDSIISVTPGNVNLPGSPWALSIPQGLTAVSMPVTRLSSLGYGIRDGDYVNIVVTLLLVDIDPSMQTILPDFSASVTAPGVASAGGQTLAVQIVSGGEASRTGRTGLDETLNQPIYLVPSEGQRARMVTQTLLQKVQVLHIGSFTFPGDPCANTQFTSVGTEATPTAAPGQQTAPSCNIKPDIVTLMVAPQDANTLVYLLYSGAKITLTLRNPNDEGLAVKTDAAMLEYLLTQYDIPVPAKLPYGSQPRLDVLTDPILPNDLTPVP
jgi:Flp pilus assembly protein CpaB